MTIDRSPLPIMSQRESMSMSDPPFPGEHPPALAYALTMMEAYVSEQLDALGAKTAAPTSRIAQLLQMAGIGVETRQQDAVKRLSQLTPREAEVLDGLADGKSNKAIAFDLNISPKTVEIHRSRIMKKLQCDSLFDLGRIWEAALSAGDPGISVAFAGRMMV